MAIICNESNVTINNSNKIICNILVRLSDIKPTQQTIDIIVNDSQLIPQVGVVAFLYYYDQYIVTVSLVSKDINNGTAVINFTLSHNPCWDASCPSQCIGSDLQKYKCHALYDINNIPTGYECIPDGTPIQMIHLAQPHL